MVIAIYYCPIFLNYLIKSILKHIANNLYIIIKQNNKFNGKGEIIKMLNDNQKVQINYVLSVLLGGINIRPITNFEYSNLNFNINEYQTTYDLYASKSFRNDISKLGTIKDLASQAGITIIEPAVFKNEPKGKFFIGRSY